MSVWITIAISVITLILSILISLLSVGSKVGRYTEKIERGERNHNDLSNEVKKLQDDLKELLHIVGKLEGCLQPASGLYNEFSRKNSPRALSDLGLKVFADMHGQAFLDKNKGVLFAEIDKVSPKTALDVESAALSACISISNKDIFNDIKVFVYNYPAIAINNEDNIEVKLSDAIFVLSLPLRDMYLQEHQDIPR